MDGDERMKGRMDGWMNGRVDGWSDVWTETVNNFTKNEYILTNDMPFSSA